MIWYRDDEITIRDLDIADAQVFTEEELRQGWHVSEEKYLEHLRHRDQGRCVPLAAEYFGEAAGYINVYREAVEGPFTGTGWPEIVDFGVLMKYRRRGVGTALISAAERIASGYADTVCLAVGLHNGYGAAQRMYVKRGYIPDGSGAWYRGKNCTPYDTVYTNDDDLVLYLSKKLPGQEKTGGGDPR